MHFRQVTNLKRQVGWVICQTPTFFSSLKRFLSLPEVSLSPGRIPGFGALVVTSLEALTVSLSYDCKLCCPTMRKQLCRLYCSLYDAQEP